MHKKKKNKSSIRYLILANEDYIFGSFNPSEEKMALKYLSKLQKEHPDVDLYKVSNLNIFLARTHERSKRRNCITKS